MADLTTVSKELGKPFPKTALKKRQGGGGRSFDYVEGHSVIHRLNDATNNQWGLAVREITTLQLGTRTVLQARVALTIPGLGTREHLGVQEVADKSGEDLIKGVITDALKKAATLFGVGLELYGDDYENATESPRIDEKGRKALEAKRSEHGLTHDQLRELAVKRYPGVTSTTELTVDQGRDLWSHIGTLPKAQPARSQSSGK